MGKGTIGVKALQTFIYALLFLCSAVILAIFSYFLAIQHHHDVYYDNRQRAVEGISGAGVLYTILAIILTCFLGGITFFAFLGIVLDILFVGGFIAIAILTDDGAKSCNNDVINTPIGSGNPDSYLVTNDGNTYGIKLHTACTMNKVVFIVSIIGAFLFLVAALFQLWLGRSHQRDKRFGPSPANNYTSGVAHRPGGFFGRRFGRNRGGVANRDLEPAVIDTNGVGHGHNNRLSHQTATTDGYVGDKYETAPANGVNPYGYENERSHAV